MREVLARTRRPPRWFWAVPIAQVPTLLLYAPRVVAGERGVPLLLLALSTVVVLAGVATMTIDQRGALVLTDDALRHERRWRPLRVDRGAVVAVDGSVPGRPDWSGHVVVTVSRPGGTRTVRLRNLDVHARQLIPRIQGWAGVGARPAPPDDVTPAP